MFHPFLYKKRITDITPDELINNGIECLFLDVDNTLSVHHGQEPADGLYAWIEVMQKNGIKLILVSNSKHKRVLPFAKKIGLPFVSLALKPLPVGFIKAGKSVGVKKKNTAAVGDQLFTDVLGAKLYGIRPILLKPILPEKMLRFRFKRKLERIIFKLEKIGE